MATDGELFLEQKYPLTRDPSGGEQFPIIDDGYLWSSMGRVEYKDIQGQVFDICVRVDFHEMFACACDRLSKLSNGQRDLHQATRASQWPKGSIDS